MKITDEQIANIATLKAEHIRIDNAEVAYFGYSPESIYRFARELISLAQEVEPLKFVKYNERHLKATFKTGYYEILTIANGAAYNIWLNGVHLLMSHHSVENAIEAAQQDYAARVKSELKYGG